MEREKASLSDIIQPDEPYQLYEYPKVSIVIPTYNNVEKISLTLDSILSQYYPDYEVIIVDAGSTDRTLEVVSHYRDERVQIFTVTGYQRYEMLNKGISQSKGEYLNCLFPGDFYVHPGALHHMMKVALDHNKPDLVYCGTLLRDGKSDPKILFRELTLKLLMRGQQPTSLQSCWFNLNSVRRLGNFSTNYYMRGGYELLCRFCLEKSLRAVSTDRVLTDYDLRLVTRKMVLTHFKETFRTLFHYFGFITAMKWLCKQKDFARLFRIWLRSVKAAFIGR